MKCYFEDVYVTVALAQFYCKQGNLNLPRVTHVQGIKYGENGGKYIILSLTGFKGGQCMLFELEEF